MYKLRSLVIFTIVLLFFLILPIFYMIYGDFLVPQLGRATFTILQYLEQPTTGKVIDNTLEFSIISSMITVILALVYAWIIARIEVPGRRFFLLLPILGLAMPDVIKAIGWTYLFNPNAGLVNVFFENVFKIHALFDIYTMTGLIIVRAVSNVPLSYLIIYPAIRSLDSHLEEASKVAGHGYLKTLLKVDVPLIRPAIVASFILAVIGGVNNFDFPYIIGGPARIQTLSTNLYFYVVERVPPSFGDGAIVGIFFAIISTILVTIYIFATKDRFKFQIITGKSITQTFHKVGNWKYVALLVCLAIVGMEFLIPFGTLFVIASTTVFQSGVAGMKLDFPHYFLVALHFPLLFSAMRVTLELGFAGGLFATLLGLFLAYSSVRSGGKQSRFVQYVSSIPLAVPGIVYGVAFLFLFLFAPGLDKLFGTVWALIIAVTFIRIPFATRIMSANFIQLSNELEEASQISGAAFKRTLRRILLPLIKSGFLNAFMYCTIDSMSDLGGVVLLAFGAATPFTVYLIQLYNGFVIVNGFSEPIVAAAAVMFVGIISLIITGISVLSHFWGRSNVAMQG